MGLVDKPLPTDKVLSWGESSPMGLVDRPVPKDGNSVLGAMLPSPAAQPSAQRTASWWSAGTAASAWAARSMSSSPSFA